MNNSSSIPSTYHTPHGRGGHEPEHPRTQTSKRQHNRYIHTHRSRVTSFKFPKEVHKLQRACMYIGNTENSRPEQYV